MLDNPLGALGTAIGQQVGVDDYPVNSDVDPEYEEEWLDGFDWSLFGEN